MHPDLQGPLLLTLMEETRDAIERELPLLEKIELKSDGWRRDSPNKEWKLEHRRDLLTLQWIIRRACCH
jgi:hypothetical protein